MSSVELDTIDGGQCSLPYPLCVSLSTGLGYYDGDYVTVTVTLTVDDKKDDVIMMG